MRTVRTLLAFALVEPVGAGIGISVWPDDDIEPAAVGWNRVCRGQDTPRAPRPELIAT